MMVHSSKVLSATPSWRRQHSSSSAGGLTRLLHSPRWLRRSRLIQRPCRSPCQLHLRGHTQQPCMLASGLVSAAWIKLAAQAYSRQHGAPGASYLTHRALPLPPRPSNRPPLPPLPGKPGAARRSATPLLRCWSASFFRCSSTCVHDTTLGWLGRCWSSPWLRNNRLCPASLMAAAPLPACPSCSPPPGRGLRKQPASMVSRARWQGPAQQQSLSRHGTGAADIWLPART